MTPESENDFCAYVERHRGALLRTAYLTCGDWHRAEDAVQTSLIKLYGAWNRTRSETVDAYTRRILAHALIDQTRRGWFRRERSYADPPELPEDPEPGGDRAEAAAILARLPMRQRVTLVLRFWEDRSVEETASILRCSTGTVKSNTARGLKTLRDHYEAPSPSVQGSK